MGSLKLSGEELAREKYKGIVTDWSINHWAVNSSGNTTTTSSNNNGNNNSTEINASSPT